MKTVFEPYTKTWFAPRFVLAVSFITVVAAALRFYGLARESLWLDEICSWHTATHDALLDVVYKDVSWHLHPPGYFLLLRGWIVLFGDSEWSLRAPSAIAGVLSVPLSYVLGCRWYGPREGLVASTLMAFLLFPVWYSQEARPYAVLLALTIGSTVLWTGLLDCAARSVSASWTVWAGYVTLAIAACYTHYFGLMLVALQLGALGLAALRDWRWMLRAALAFGVVIVAYVPWWPSFWQQLTADSGLGHPTPQSGFVATTLRWLGEYFDYRSPHAGWISFLGLAYLAVLAVLAIRAGLAWGQRDPESKRVAVVRALVTAGWLVVPFAFAYWKSVSSASIYTQRNLIISAPVVYLLAARALVLLPRRWLIRTAIILFVCVSALVRTTVSSGYYTQPFKDDFRNAAHVVKQESGALRDAGIAGTGYNVSTLNYYFKRMGMDRRVEFWGGKDADISRFDRWVNQQRPQHILYVIAFPGPEAGFAQHLLDTTTPVRMVELKNVKVLVLRNPDPLAG